MLIKGNEINLPSLHDLSAHGWGHLTVPCPASLKCISPYYFSHLPIFPTFFLLFRLFFALTLEYGVAAEVVLERKGWRAKEHLA